MVAVFATARKLATVAYRMLRWGQEYADITPMGHSLTVAVRCVGFRTEAPAADPTPNRARQ